MYLSTKARTDSRPWFRALDRNLFLGLRLETLRSKGVQEFLKPFVLASSHLQNVAVLPLQFEMCTRNRSIDELIVSPINTRHGAPFYIHLQFENNSLKPSQT
jgi:hypothetical protein